jgi:hypothetical protein
MAEEKEQTKRPERGLVFGRVGKRKPPVRCP